MSFYEELSVLYNQRCYCHNEIDNGQNLKLRRHLLCQCIFLCFTKLNIEINLDHLNLLGNLMLWAGVRRRASAVNIFLRIFF